MSAPQVLPPLLLGSLAMQEHDPGFGHPERAERLASIEALLASRAPMLPWEEPPLAPAEALTRVHRPMMVERVFAQAGRTASLDPDTHMSEGSLPAAQRAAGAALAAVDALLEGRASTAFAAVRPPGHHATADVSMGFCLFNNIAIAAEHARRHHGIERVLIVDWDVHHGNGTEAIFYDDPSVLFFSTHQFPFYPGTGAIRRHGARAGEGHNVNVPLPAGSTDHDLRVAFQEILRPIADQFEPELVLVSAGFDAHRLDPLGQMDVTEEGFADLCAEVVAIAQTHAHGRLGLFLEGGYDVEALARSVLACVEVLGGHTPPDQRGDPSRWGREAIDAAKRAHGAYWSL